jgi:hypothetical protein
MLHKSPLDITNTNFSSLSNNPSRVDRLIAEYHHEYNRVKEFYLVFLLTKIVSIDYSFI